MTTTQPTTADVLRQHAEDAFADELAALAAVDDRPRPPRWQLSPWAVATYLLGGTLADGTAITPKYIGQRRLIEIAVATLATDRALLLLGVPGTAKIVGGRAPRRRDRGRLDAAGAGHRRHAEEALRYGWNYARLLAEGPSREALVPSPVMRAMETGTIARVEELTRIPPTCRTPSSRILSEKTLPIPELDDRGPGAPGLQRHRHRQQPRQGRQRPVGGAQAPLQHRRAAAARHARARRSRSSARRVAALGARAGAARPTCAALAEIRRVVTIFRELRSGVTADGTTLKSPSGTLSTAEAISVMTNGLALAAHFGDGVVRAADVAAGLVGAVVKDPVQDRVVWQEYLETVVQGARRTGRTSTARAGSLG